MSAIKSILLVDDDETTNFLNQFFIRQSMPNLDIYVALNGEEALTLIKDLDKKFLPSLVLLDTQMPIMDGWEFLERYESTVSEDVRDKIKVILLTALESKEIQSRIGENSQVFDTAQKPLSDVTLKKLVSKCNS